MGVGTVSFIGFFHGLKCVHQLASTQLLPAGNIQHTGDVGEADNFLLFSYPPASFYMVKLGSWQEL